MRKTLSVITMLLLITALATAQNREITGKVSDSTGNAVSGATIKIKGLKGGVSASVDGAFRISAPQNGTLVISAVGFETQEVRLGAGSTIDVQLHTAGSRVLNEVVVTALGIKREKRELTYSTQELKGETLVAAKTDNLVNSLAGKVSGVQISNSTGMPGSSSRIVIRGATSLVGDNQPLFIVDGIPIDNSEAGAIDATGGGPDNTALSQGSGSNRAIDIDPNIIETMTVLKGAAATALYGSAAARGAIIITTKMGIKSSKPQVSLSSSYSWNTPYYMPFQDKYAQGTGGKYVDGNNGQFASTSWGPLIDTLRVNGQPVKKYNPQKLFFRTGHTTDNNISVSGAGDKSRYMISYSYLKTDGIMPHTDFARHSVFGKFSNQITDKITATVQINYISSVNNRVEEGNGLTSPLWTVFAAPISWNPFPTTNPDGTQRLYRVGRNNPYFLLDNTGFVSTVNRFLPVATLVYNATPWLSITERIGADIYTDQSTYHESNLVNLGVFNNNGGVTNRTQTFRQFNNDLIVELHKNLTDDLFGSLTVGTNLFSQNSEFYQQIGIGQTVADFYNISSMSSTTSSDILSKYRKVGYYAQANLEYKKMLNLALTGRYDGSSVLASNKNYYPYGSAALGFIFTELMPSGGSPLSFGKIRASYSAVGNDNLSPYSLTTQFINATGTANNISYPYNGQAAFLLANVLGNSTLKNESLKEYEGGLELKFLKNRLSFEGSYFYRKTTDLLTPTPINPSSGFFKYNLNAGSMQDKGIELLLSGTPIKNRNFTWEVSANFTRIRNKVLKLATGVDKLQFGGFGGGGGVYAFTGLPYGVLYGSKYLRDSATNKIIVDDNGIPQVGANGIIGSTQPDFLAGLSNTFTYKGLSFSFVFDWKQGGDIYNLDDHYNWFYGTPKATANRNPITVPGIVQSTGKANTTPITAQTWFQTVSNIDEAVIENSTYIKLRSVSLSYTLAQSTIKSLPFKSITVNLSGNNLWIYKPHFTGSDPEVSISGSGNGQGVTNYLTPTTRNFILGLRVAF